MSKQERIQIRVDEERKQWLMQYAKDKSITVSKMFIDFIDWLKKKEDRKENG